VQAPSILIASADLTCSSALAAAARKSGLAVITASNAANCLAASRDQAIRLYLLDLQLPQLPLETLVSELRAAQPLAQIVAFGPHVQSERLKAARASGCDQVLTRGQFFERLEELVGRSAGAGESESPS